MLIKLFFFLIMQKYIKFLINSTLINFNISKTLSQKQMQKTIEFLKLPDGNTRLKIGKWIVMYGDQKDVELNLLHDDLIGLLRKVVRISVDATPNLTCTPRTRVLCITNRLTPLWNPLHRIYFKDLKIAS